MTHVRLRSLMEREYQILGPLTHVLVDLSLSRCWALSRKATFYLNFRRVGGDSFRDSSVRQRANPVQEGMLLRGAAAPVHMVAAVAGMGG